MKRGSSKSSLEHNGHQENTKFTSNLRLLSIRCVLREKLCALCAPSL